jgi:hypothetical protein
MHLAFVVPAIAELILSGLGHECASEVRVTVQVGQECQCVCVAIINNDPAADLQNSTNTMILAAVTGSDSLCSSMQTSHLKLLPTSGSGIFGKEHEV